MKHRWRLTIVTWEGGGNVPPALALGARLVRSGHRVRLLGPASVGSAAVDSDLEFAAYRSVPEWPSGLAQDDDWDRFSAMLNGRPVIDDILGEVRAEPPDVLVVDCMMGAALAVAEYLHLPTAVLVHVLYQPFVEQWGHHVVDTGEARTSLGLHPLNASSAGEPLARTGRVLALTPPGFDFPIDDLPGNTTYVGPILPPDPPTGKGNLPGGLFPGDRAVLISFSTTLQGQREALPLVLDAMAKVPARGVLTLGGVMATDAIRPPPNVVVSGYVPHAALLPHMSLVVCHGGLSTVMAALAHGVPLVCIPQGRDQHLNAARVEACGVGRTVQPDAPASSIAATIRDTLDDANFREAAQRMAALIADAGAGAEATRLVEALLPAPPREWASG